MPHERHHHRVRPGRPDRRALHRARQSASRSLIEGLEAGGQLMLTTLVENFPGLPRRHHGPGSDGRDARAGGAVRRRDHPGQRHRASTCARTPIVVKTAEAEYTAKTLIIATGASARLLGLPSERTLMGHGVSTCATCDGYFFRGQEIAVVGGGDSAMEEAMFLTRFASKVTLVHRRDTLRASKIMQDKARANPKIAWMLEHEVEEINDTGKGEVTGDGRCATNKTGDEDGDSGRRRLRRDRPHAEHVAVPRPARARSRTATSSRTTARRPACPACSRAATSRITSTGRRSPPPDPAAWRRSTPSTISTTSRSISRASSRIESSREVAERTVVSA